MPKAFWVVFEVLQSILTVLLEREIGAPFCQRGLHATLVICSL